MTIEEAKKLGFRYILYQDGVIAWFINSSPDNWDYVTPSHLDPSIHFPTRAALRAAKKAKRMAAAEARQDARVADRKAKDEEAPKPNPVRESVMAEAERIIHGARRKSYGPVGESFTAIAATWTAYLRLKMHNPDMPALDGVDVCMMMDELKVLRHCIGRGRDDLVDLCGYAGLAEELENDGAEHHEFPKAESEARS